MGRALITDRMVHRRYTNIVGKKREEIPPVARTDDI